MRQSAHHQLANSAYTGPILQACTDLARKLEVAHSAQAEHHIAILEQLRSMQAEQQVQNRQLLLRSPASTPWQQESLLLLAPRPPATQQVQAIMAAEALKDPSMPCKPCRVLSLQRCICNALSAHTRACTLLRKCFHAAGPPTSYCCCCRMLW